MLAALFSFLGGSVFRMVWGEISSFVNKRQDHAHEMEMARLQNDMEAARAERDSKRIQLQHELQVKEVVVQGDVAIQSKEADAFIAAIQAAARPTGIKWVDGWNGAIRPSYATVALLLWLAKVGSQSFVMDEFDYSLLAVIAGFYFADRSLGKRGK